MKKNNVSFMTLFMLTAALVGGCSCGKQDNENVSNLVIKVGDKEYSAKQLYNDLLSTGTGANEAFAKVLRLVVESSMKTTNNIQAAADRAAEVFEEEVSNQALSTGVSKDDVRSELIKEKGYTSVDEMKADIIYKEKLTRLSETYWEENKANYYNNYVENRLPYFMRQVLVMINSNNNQENSNRQNGNIFITKTEAKKIVDVIKRFESGDSFKYVASEESDDSLSTGTGGAYFIDSSYSTYKEGYGFASYVDEFVYGTYAFDAYTTKSVENNKVVYTYGANQTKLSKLKGISDTETFAKYYENGFNFVDMSLVNILEEVHNASTNTNDREYFAINSYKQDLDEDGEVKLNEDGSMKVVTANNIHYVENYYARSIIFNQAFNKPGVSVIGYNTEAEAIAAGAKNYVELKNGTDSKFVLADENDNPIFFVVARAGNGTYYLHFLTINVSALDDVENAKKFFSLTPDASDSYNSYVELMNLSGEEQEKYTLTKEIENHIKSYVTQGIGDVVGEESILNYDMVNHYINKNNITYLNDDLKNAINAYITNKKHYFEVAASNLVAESWDKHTTKLETYMSDFVQSYIKPYECGVLLDTTDLDSRKNVYDVISTSDNLCRYVYGVGYQVQLLYYYETTAPGKTEYTFNKVDNNKNNRMYFDNTSGYKQYVTIGEQGSERIKLPEPKLEEGYEFLGWYTDKDLTNKVEYVDLSVSKPTNNTVFFADIREKDVTTITYTYQYEDGSAVDTDVVINNTNTLSQRYVENGNNIITFATNKIDSKYVTATKFLNSAGTEISSITLTEQDKNQAIEIIVVVAPKATTLKYEYVDNQGNPVDQTVQSDNDLDSVTYNLNGNNDVAINLEDFVWPDSDNLEAVSIKVARGENPKFSDTENKTSLTITQEDMGQEITIYVVVNAKVGGGQ